MWEEMKLLTSHQLSPSLRNSWSLGTNTLALSDFGVIALWQITVKGKRISKSIILNEQICSTWRSGRTLSCFEQFSMCLFAWCHIDWFHLPVLQGWADTYGSGVTAILNHMVKFVSKEPHHHLIQVGVLLWPCWPIFTVAWRKMVSLPRCKQFYDKENKPNNNFSCKWPKINVLVLADIQIFADQSLGKRE